MGDLGIGMQADLAGQSFHVGSVACGPVVLPGRAAGLAMRPIIRYWPAI
ncbi:MAG TPA: hypothetical protein VJ577_17185 [Burkholderiaceae bacterium]|nr:hypothetical protein [Burkholderiaceae bacterium]